MTDDETATWYRVVCECGAASHERGCHETVAEDWRDDHASMCEYAQSGRIDIRAVRP